MSFQNRLSVLIGLVLCCPATSFSQGYSLTVSVDLLFADTGSPNYTFDLSLKGRFVDQFSLVAPDGTRLDDINGGISIDDGDLQPADVDQYAGQWLIEETVAGAVEQYEFTIDPIHNSPVFPSIPEITFPNRYIRVVPTPVFDVTWIGDNECLAYTWNRDVGPPGFVPIECVENGVSRFDLSSQFAEGVTLAIFHRFMAFDANTVPITVTPLSASAASNFGSSFRYGTASSFINFVVIPEPAVGFSLLWGVLLAFMEFRRRRV